MEYRVYHLTWLDSNIPVLTKVVLWHHGRN